MEDDVEELYFIMKQMTVKTIIHSLTPLNIHLQVKKVLL